MSKDVSDRKLGNPTLVQIRYLEELRNDSGDRGILTRIAASCETHHDLVRRYIKKCMDVGYVDKNYQLTDIGSRWLDEYLLLRENLRQYFLYIGVDELQVEAKMAALLEAMDLETIYQMLAAFTEVAAVKSFQLDTELPEGYLERLLARGSVNIPFNVLKIQEESQTGEVSLSMAHQGFLSPAVLKKNNRGVFLVMSVCDMHANSRVNGKMMCGHLSRLKYEQNGNMIPTEIRGSKLKIPLEACKFRRRPQGGFEASVKILCSCTVGTNHMPESKAKLVFCM